jgi:hypothetical protein
MTVRERTSVVTGLAIVALGWLCLRGTPAALARVRALEDELKQRVELVERARRETSDLQPLSDSIAQLEHVARSLHRVILIGGESTTAAFDLTRRVSESLSRTTAFVHSVESVPDSVRSVALRRVSVRASLETDIVGLVGILTRLDNDSILAVESVDIAAPSPGDPQTTVERLQILLGVSAWFIPDTTLSRPTPAISP